MLVNIRANFLQASTSLRVTLIKDYRIPRSSKYEMVYHGSFNDLTNIPLQMVALVREREPWTQRQRENGRGFTLWLMGFVKLVESDDSFSVLGSGTHHSSTVSQSMTHEFWDSTPGCRV